MKLVAILAGVALALMTSLPAQAQYGDRDQRRTDRPAQERRGTEQPPQRDGRAERPGRQGGSLTPEERRQLRQDIGQHGREIYQDRGDRGRRRR